MSTFIHERVDLARKGENPTVITRMESGWLVLSDRQVLNGYCILLPDPVVASINDLPLPERETYLRDMSIVGDALLEVTGAWRINYEILGNSEPALHAHIIPRYAAEPDERRRMPVWFYDWEQIPQFDLARHKPLMEKIAAAIHRRTAWAGG